MVLNAGSIIGSIVLARVIDRLGPYLVIGPAYLIGLVFVGLIGFVPGPLPLALANVFLAGFFSIGAQVSAVSLCAAFYPTAIRATGIGWCLGTGRIGAIAGPVVGGILIGAGVATSGLFLAAAAASLIAGIAILAMRLKPGPARVSLRGARQRPFVSWLSPSTSISKADISYPSAMRDAIMGV